jgi:hypothetical protein
MLEFKGLHSKYTSENLSRVVFSALQDLNIKHKLFAIVSDSASNNSTLVDHLHKQLLNEFNNKLSDVFNSKLVIRFQGQKGYIHCIAYALNRICKDILAKLKSSTVEP